MKKFLSFAAIAALTTFAASCGNGEDEAKRKADSTHNADSLAQIETQRKADSTHMADSVNNAAAAAEAKRVSDSTHMADSLAATKKGGKPKTAPEKQKIENKKATGGRG